MVVVKTDYIKTLEDDQEIVVEIIDSPGEYLELADFDTPRLLKLYPRYPDIMYLDKGQVQILVKTLQRAINQL